MNDIVIFVFGLAIFGAYLFGLLSMINTQHKIQAREQINYEKGRAKRAAEGATVAGSKDMG